MVTKAYRSVVDGRVDRKFRRDGQNCSLITGFSRISFNSDDILFHRNDDSVLFVWKKNLWLRLIR